MAARCRRFPFFLALLVFLVMPCRLFAKDSDMAPVDTSPVTENDKEAAPYTDEEFPQWAKDLRRGEIITLGSVPFVGLWVVGGYGGYKYFSGKTDSFPNPFSSKDAFEKQEIWTMVGVTAGIGLGIGLTDFFVNLSRRKKAEKERLLQEAKDREGITPLTPEEAGQLLRENNRKKRTEE
ncbi:MAG: hypothetical protein K6G18_17090 [Treponema sp.]|nr:hypothetical protein [Treponema sp.]MCR5623557.1 hypothetical protein [Treponema sp.]